MYSEGFFREGSHVWPKSRLAEYPAFESWEGVESLKTRIAEHFGIASAQDVFLANRSAQLVRIAARMMFRTCRNVLTSDLNWPHWQKLVKDEAARSGQQTTDASIQDVVLNDRSSAKELIERLEATFFNNGCDGIFLPTVNNVGIRLPLSKLLFDLKSSGQLRFALIDAAQSFCHLPEPAPSTLADVTITGCHKWLRGSLPLGIAICGRPLVADQIRTILKSSGSSGEFDDPLLRFTQQICNCSVDNSSETVCVAPLFSANAAIRSSQTARSSLREQISRQLINMHPIERSAAGTTWSILEIDASVRSGIFLMRSSDPVIQNMGCDQLRTQFCRWGAAISAYPHGLIRISAPTETVCEHSIDTLAAAFAGIA